VILVVDAKRNALIEFRPVRMYKEASFDLNNSRNPYGTQSNANKMPRHNIIGIDCLFVVFTWACMLNAQDLIEPAPEMPTFTLGSVNQTRDAFGRPSVSIDYDRTKVGTGVPTLAGRSSDGPLKIMGGRMLHDASGKLELSDLFPNGKGLDAELYLTVSGSFAEECSFQCLVSNVVRIGNPSGPSTTAREWNSKENVAYQKELVGRKPPITPPTDYQIVQAGTKLIPGMPIKVGRFGEWLDAEALTGDPTVTVKISGVPDLRNLTRSGWIAIKPSVLQQGDSSPGMFKPSVRLIPGTTVPLPDGYVPVTESMEIVPGTPVRAIWMDKLEDSTVISVHGDELLIHYDSKPSAFDKKHPRRLIVISEETLEQLAKPNAAKTFESRVPKRSSAEEEFDNQARKIEEESKRNQEQVSRNIAELRKAMAGKGFDNAGGLPALPMMVQNNPIDIPIPKEAELLPLDFPIPRGTKLAACWGGRWNYVTVLKDGSEDNVAIHWDDRTSDFDGLIHRSQLIIRRLDIKKLRAKNAKQDRREWTDATGKFKVEAKLTARTATHVTLFKDDGKEIKLAIEKLSSADQQWLKENP